jgi:UDP-N-acetylglucosamine 3-dehydrogenase
MSLAPQAHFGIMADMRNLKIAVIGLGNMGKYHVKHSQTIPGAELVAICDTDPERVRLAQETAAGVPGFTSIASMLAAVTVDLACVVVPTFLHAKIAGELLCHGVHVLVEKPIASTIQEAESLIQIAIENKKRLFVGHVEYFNPATQAFFNHIKTNSFGQIYQICARRWSPMPMQITDANVIIDLCIHDLHIVAQLIAESPTHTTWHSKSHVLDNRADAATGILHFPTAMACIDANWVSSAKVRDMEIVAQNGVAKIDLLNQRLFISSPSQPEWTETAITKAWPLETELTHVLHAIRTGDPSPIDAKEGLRALQFCS